MSKRFGISTLFHSLKALIYPEHYVCSNEKILEKNEKIVKTFFKSNYVKT